jgi:NifB/MoaA-like Fe-S oxidoreductase
VVICPGINNGEHLEKTVNDLFTLYPGVETLGIVPIGLTKYRKKLPDIKPFTTKKAIETIDYLEKRQKEFKKKCGSRFVFMADEFYILANRDFPSIYEYEAMEQFENGIGMMRLLLTDFNRRKRILKRHRIGKKILMITGKSAHLSLENLVISKLRKYRINVHLLPVKNKFWGKNVTVSGLLTGGDILSEIKKLRPYNYDVAILPPNSLNNDDLFLDDMSLGHFKSRVETEVMVGKYSIIDTLKKAVI